MRTRAPVLAPLALLVFLAARALFARAGEPPARAGEPPARAGEPASREGAPAEVKTKYAAYLELPEEKRKLLVRQYVRERPDGTCVVAQSKYRMVSELAGGRTLELAIRMDDFYGCLSGLFLGPFKWAGQPEARLFRDRERYVRHLEDELYVKVRPGNAALFFVRGSRRLLLAYEGARLVENLQHEGAHQFLYYYLGNAALQAPRWLHEGFATNLETWDMALGPRTNIDESTRRSPWKKRAYLLHASGRLPRFRAFLHEEWRGTRDEYALAWSLGNSLLRDGKGLEVFNAMLASLRAGKKALHGYTAEHYASLEEHWKRHLEEQVGPACREPANEAERAAQERLRRALEHEKWEVRRRAALLLFAMTADVGAVLPVLTRALADGDAGVRASAAEALGSVGPAAQAASGALEKALKDADASVRKAAAAALAKIRAGPDKDKNEDDAPKKRRPADPARR